jgi:hypothetical protein
MPTKPYVAPIGADNKRFITHVGYRRFPADK